MKILIIALLGLAGLMVAGVLVAGPRIQQGLSALAPRPQGTKVRSELVKTAKLIETVKAPGKIEPRTKVEVSAEIASRIESLPFREGDEVHKGDMIVKLDDREFKASLASAKARSAGEEYRLHSEQARLAGLLSTYSFAQKQLERQQALFDSGDLPRKDLDNAQERTEDLKSQIDAAKFAISVIESSLEAAKAEMDRSSDSLSKTIITAPMDGVVTALNAEVGEVVLMGTMNNPGTVIMTIADLSRMLLKAEVSEADIAKVAMGQSARVHINAYRELNFSGTVTQIALQRTEPREAVAASASTTTGYFEAEIEIDLQGKRILSGLQANVDIEIASHEGLLLESQSIVDRPIEELPDQVKTSNALVDPAHKTTTVVFRIVNNKAVCTPVKRGPSDDTHSVVLAGLNEGDVAVVGPFKVLEKIKHDELLEDEGNKAKPETSDKAEKEEGGPKVRVRVR